MQLNFEAPLRLTEALLPLLRATAARSPADAERRVCIVNVSSTAGDELLASAKTRWLVGRPETVAEAILDAGPGGRAERYALRPYWLVAASRTLAPAIVRRAVAGGAFTTRTGDRS